MSFQRLSLAVGLSACLAAPVFGADALTVAVADGCLGTSPSFKNAAMVFANSGLSEVKSTGAGERIFTDGNVRASVIENTECAVEAIITPTAGIGVLWGALDDVFPDQYSRDRDASGVMIWAIRPASGKAMDAIIHPLSSAGVRIEVRVLK